MSIKCLVKLIVFFFDRNWKTGKETLHKSAQDGNILPSTCNISHMTNSMMSNGRCRHVVGFSYKGSWWKVSLWSKYHCALTVNEARSRTKAGICKLEHCALQGEFCCVAMDMIIYDNPAACCNSDVFFPCFLLKCVHLICYLFYVFMAGENVTIQNGIWKYKNNHLSVNKNIHINVIYILNIITPRVFGRIKENSNWFRKENK